MIFNSLLSIVYAIGLLTGYYVYKWPLYQPYLINERLFWVLILASIINIFPSAVVGQVKTGRLWFHHYVYGFIISALAIIFTIMWAPVSLFSLFTTYTTNVSVNVGRFFALGGLTLIVDDLPDVSNVLRRALSFLKLKTYQGRRIMHVTQSILSFFSVYLLVAVALSFINNPLEATIANLIFFANLLAASLISFGIVKQKIWLQMTFPKDREN